TVIKQAASAARGEGVQVPAIELEPRESSMHQEAPRGAAIDRQVEDTVRPQHARQLPPHGFHVLDVVDAVVDDGEVITRAVARDCLTDTAEVANGRVPESREDWVGAVERLQGIDCDTLVRGEE